MSSCLEREYGVLILSLALNSKELASCSGTIANSLCSIGGLINSLRVADSLNLKLSIVSRAKIFEISNECLCLCDSEGFRK